MKVFTEHSFDTMPTKDGYYMVINKEGERYGYDFVVGHGWNCKRLHDNKVTSVEYAISAEDMKESYTCWLEPHTIGAEDWYYTLITMKEEIKNRILDYADMTVSEEVQDELNDLDELYSLIETAKDFAERFK